MKNQAVVIVAIIACVTLIAFVINSRQRNDTSSAEPDALHASAPPVVTKSRSEADVLADQSRFLESFHEPSYRGSINALLSEVTAFADTWRAINDAKYLPELSKPSKDLERRLVKLQKSQFPKIRKEYTALVKKSMWEHNVDVSTSGTTIIFTAGMFVSNAEIKGFNDVIFSTLAALRFKQVRYQWYEGSEYQYYKIAVPQDGEPVSRSEIPS